MCDVMSDLEKAALRSKRLREESEELTIQIALLEEKRRELEGELEALREHLKQKLESSGLTHASGHGWEVVIAPAGGNPAVELLVPVEELPPEYRRLTPNLRRLAADLKAGRPAVQGIARFAARKTALYIY